MQAKQKVIAIVGATATGKTKLAISRAKKINGEIISADSRLIYKEFDIATAKPTLEERCGIEHYLIDILEPQKDYSVANFCDDAKEAIKKISDKGKIPIVVGGTGLYFKILLEGYSLPKIKPNYELREKLSILDREKLYEILKELDSEAAEKITDKRKFIRAIEIVKTLGIPLSKAGGACESEFDVEWIGLNFHDRNLLYDRVNKRVDIMLEKGLLNEAKNLLTKYGKIPSLMGTIGYKELIEHFEGKCDFEEAVRLIKQNSRHYAKRQLTWFRQNSKINWQYLD